MDQSIQVVAYPQAFDGRKVGGAPPRAIVLGKGVPSRQSGMLAVRDAVQLVLDAGLLLDQLATGG